MHRKTRRPHPIFPSGGAQTDGQGTQRWDTREGRQKNRRGEPNSCLAGGSGLLPQRPKQQGKMTSGRQRTRSIESTRVTIFLIDLVHESNQKSSILLLVDACVAALPSPSSRPTQIDPTAAHSSLAAVSPPTHKHTTSQQQAAAPMLGQAARGSRLLLQQRAPAAAFSLSSATHTAARRRPLHHLAGADAPRRLLREERAAAAGAAGGARGRALVPPVVGSVSAAAPAAAAPWKGEVIRSSSSRRALSSQAAHRGGLVDDIVDPGRHEDLPVPVQPPQPPQQQQPQQQRQPAEYYRAHQDGGAAPREGPEQRVSVMAFYVGQKLDLISVCGLYVYGLVSLLALVAWIEWTG